MTELLAIAYESTAVGGLTADDLDRLLLDSRSHNQIEDVTGALLYDGRRFFQYIEGPSTGVERIYARIVGARQHRHLVEHFRGPVPQRQFRAWHMGFRTTPTSMMQRLSDERWQREVPWIESGQHSPALEVLLAFWRESEPR